MTQPTAEQISACLELARATLTVYGPLVDHARTVLAEGAPEPPVVPPLPLPPVDPGESLTDKQARFASMFGRLLNFVDTLPDHRVRVSWGYRDKKANKRIGGHPKSTHLHRLAEDVILDKRINGRWVWQKSSAAYAPLGEFWESIGGTWGGRFGDGGHFSLKHNGIS